LLAEELESDVLIIGAGIVGLAIAYQLLERGISNNIVIIEKEKEIGMHSSGRNSGVLHAGIYYKPGSLKAKVCISGAKRLKSWITKRKLPISNCGKVIVPTKKKLDHMIDVLYERGLENGADVSIINKSQLKETISIARSASGRAIWSPNTSVTKPIAVIQQLEKELKSHGVKFIKNSNILNFDIDNKIIEVTSGNSISKISYFHLYNCSGVQADKIAKLFNVGDNYFILPFKGLYWKTRKLSKIKLSTNLYPVPDLSVPFLGIHFTPNTDKEPEVNIGPTATPAFGRENYKGLKGIEPAMAIKNLSILAEQYLFNKNNFRSYVHQQAFLSLSPLLLQEAQLLIPQLKKTDIEISHKIGIRPQLFNNSSKELVDDFICIQSNSSTHILNAISPAFTASFSLADLIIDKKIESHGQ